MTAPKKTDWWYSADGKRGFCFGAVKGFDHRTDGNLGNRLHLYLEGAILFLVGAEADVVFALIKGKEKA